MEAIREVVEAGAMITAMGPLGFAFETQKLCMSHVKENKAHLLWAYPLNGVVTVLALAVQPILSLIVLVVTPIFKLIGCCSDEWDEVANTTFKMAATSFACRPHLFVNIFNPAFEADSGLDPKKLIDNMAPSYFAASPVTMALMTAKLHNEYREQNVAHVLWTYPLNGIVTILAIAVQPILSVIAIVAAAIFRQLGCCSEAFDELANKTFHAAIAGLIAIPDIFVKMIYPPFEMD